MFWFIKKTYFVIVAVIGAYFTILEVLYYQFTMMVINFGDISAVEMDAVTA